MNKEIIIIGTYVILEFPVNIVIVSVSIGAMLVIIRRLDLKPSLIILVQKLIKLECTSVYKTPQVRQ